MPPQTSNKRVQLRNSLAKRSWCSRFRLGINGIERYLIHDHIPRQRNNDLTPKNETIVIRVRFVFLDYIFSGEDTPIK